MRLNCDSAAFVCLLICLFLGYVFLCLFASFCFVLFCGTNSHSCPGSPFLCSISIYHLFISNLPYPLFLIYVSEVRDVFHDST